MSSLSAFGSDGKGEPRDPLPSKAGSSISLASAVRVTSDTTTAIGTGIAANTDATTATSSTAELEGTIPGTEGLATVTRCRTGFQVSYMAVGAILIPGIPKPLTEGGASSGHKFGVSTGPTAAHSSGHSSDRLAHLAASAIGNGGASNTAKGSGDCIRFTTRSPMASTLAARFFNAGTSAHRVASCSPPADVAAGSRRTTEVAMTS
ncbi:uncharacterized protein [Miscanthus floridulus]|uniref:uncharacterized protein n=1 Tax=Miscanthus floridulus TaxID=154761 RepID=UPI003459929D